MDFQSLKIDLIHWLTEIKDEVVLEKVNALREEYSNLTETQKTEIDRRLDKYQRGEMEFSSWENVKEKVRAKNI
jgi:putative addiction module component (TIGR02574 family)